MKQQEFLINYFKKIFRSNTLEKQNIIIHNNH